MCVAVQVESTQNMIRIVGLSATLPNYLDIARFLRVNPHQGLFFFDGRFRPVPLSQSFVGVKAPNKMKALRDMDEVCYDKVLENVRKGHQVPCGRGFTEWIMGEGRYSVRASWVEQWEWHIGLAVEEWF